MTADVEFTVLPAQVMERLRDVIDPELAINVVELGMVGDIEVEDSAVLVNMRLTSMSCPFWDLFVDQVKAAVGALDGVHDVTVRFDRRQPWSPDLMSAAARTQLEAIGLMPPSMQEAATGSAGRTKLIQLVDGVLSSSQLAPPNGRDAD
jgi:metal-sulfur cluster biosynthetic enzyme